MGRPVLARPTPRLQILLDKPQHSEPRPLNLHLVRHSGSPPPLHREDYSGPRLAGCSGPQPPPPTLPLSGVGRLDSRTQILSEQIPPLSPRERVSVPPLPNLVVYLEQPQPPSPAVSSVLRSPSRSTSGAQPPTHSVLLTLSAAEPQPSEPTKWRKMERATPSSTRPPVQTR